LGLIGARIIGKFALIDNGFNTIGDLSVDIAVSGAVDRIQQRIEEKIGPQRFKIWFKNSTRLSLEQKYLRIDVPSAFIGGWIENHFSDHIASAAKQTLGKMVDVTVVVDPQLLLERRSGQANSQAKYIHQGRSNTPGSGSRDRSTGKPRLRHDLDSFVVGEPNQLAYNTVMSVADKVVSPFNPLFIHGACGVGKTHLLQGLGNALLGRGRGVGACYISGEEFTNQFILSIRTGTLEGFRRKYRNVDVLLIDDVHFLANKRATQDEFLHTFNAINTAGKQLVLASDAHPRMIGQLSEALLTRFVGGMVVKIDPPDQQMRSTILKGRCAILGHDVPQAVLDLLAQRVSGNVRELEGALLKLVAYCSLCGRTINLAMAQKVVDEYLHRRGSVIRISDIESVVATYFGLHPADIHASNRTRTVALARSVAMYLARKHTQASFPQIGKYMGNKNHSTVILACKRIEQLLKHDDQAVFSSLTGLKSVKIRQLLDLLEEQLTKPEKNKRNKKTAARVV